MKHQEDGKVSREGLFVLTFSVKCQAGGSIASLYSTVDVQPSISYESNEYMFTYFAKNTDFLYPDPLLHPGKRMPLTLTHKFSTFNHVGSLVCLFHRFLPGVAAP